MRSSMIPAVVGLLFLKLATATPVEPRRITVPLSGPSDHDERHNFMNLDTVKRHLTRISWRYSCDDGVSDSLRDRADVQDSVTRSDLINLKRAGPPALGLTKFDGPLWFGKVDIGTSPSTTFSVQIDTGISDLIVIGPDCIDEKCEGRVRYNPTSKTSNPLKKPFSIQYDGDQGETISGKRYMDDLYLSNIHLRYVIMGVASTWTGKRSDQYAVPDAILGLGFRRASRINPTRPNILEALFGGKAIEQMMFGYKVGNMGGTNSELSLGFANNELYTDDITWVPVIGEEKAERWAVPLQGIIMNDMTFTLQEMSVMNVIIDTSATFIHAHPTIVNMFYAAVDGALDLSDTLQHKLWSIPCETIPLVALQFGNQQFHINPDTFVVRIAADDGTITCVGALVADTFGSNNVQMIIGSVFLRNVYTIFHFGNDHTDPHVGFAALRDLTQPQQP